jgi:hypothetical protein
MSDITQSQYMSRYSNNYELWAKEILNMSISSDQRSVAEAFKEEKFVAAKSGTGCGKTCLAATKALWFFTTHPEAKVVCTAPTGHQLEDLLFAEMESWIRKIQVPFIRKAINIIKGKIYIEGFKDWFIVGRTIPKDSSDKLGDVLAGFHAPHLFFIIDEASAVPDQVFSGIEGSMLQKNVHCLLVGNPTRSSGYFYDCFHKNAKSWANVTLSSERSPYNDITYIERMKEIHGEESDWFRTKCLGEFPRGGGQIVANYEQIAAAQERWREAKPEDFDGMLVAGLDPSAGRHDSSILTFRKGAYIYEPERINHSDGPDLIPKVISRMKAMGARELYIDYTGLGVILYDLFRRANKSFKVYKVVTNSRASNPEAYRNLRAELYKELSNNFDELCLPCHERYMQELPEIAFLEDKEPIQVIDKPKLKLRLKFSPDFSDSLMVSTYRHFNLGVTYNAHHDTMAFELMNNALATESSFAKI